MESRQFRSQEGFHILNFKILFKTMFNMNMLFEFVTIVFNNHMFKVSISKIHSNTCNTLQSRLQIDEILTFSYFQINGALKYTCKLSFFFHVTIKLHQTSKVKYKNNNIHQSI